MHGRKASQLILLDYYFDSCWQTYLNMLSLIFNYQTVYISRAEWNQITENVLMTILRGIEFIFHIKTFDGFSHINVEIWCFSFDWFKCICMYYVMYLITKGKDIDINKNP